MRCALALALIAAGCTAPSAGDGEVASRVAQAPPPTPVEDVGLAYSGRRPDADTRTWNFVVVTRAEERLELVGRDIGRGGFAVDELPENGLARELNVLTPTWSEGRVWLSFEFVPVDGDGDWQIALAEGCGDAFHVVATSEHVGAAWADWAVASPDGSRVAAWVLDDEAGVLHVMERRGDTLVVVERRHADAVKCFPRFAPNGRIAARLPLRGDPLRYANAIDGVVGESLRAAREVQFDATGERWAYAGRRAAGWFVFAGTGSEPAAEAGPFDEVNAFTFDGPPSALQLVRARVRDASGWRWVELERP